MSPSKTWRSLLQGYVIRLFVPNQSQIADKLAVAFLPLDILVALEMAEQTWFG
jgi:hypothetical protein